MVEIRRGPDSHPFKNQGKIVLKNVTCAVNLDKAFLNFFEKHIRSNKEESRSPPQTNKQTMINLKNIIRKE